MLKNITITLSEEAAHWARMKAAEQSTSVSRLVGRMIEDRMRRGDDYWLAYEQWKAIRPCSKQGAATRMSRDEVHARR